MLSIEETLIVVRLGLVRLSDHEDTRQGNDDDHGHPDDRSGPLGKEPEHQIEETAEHAHHRDGREKLHQDRVDILEYQKNIVLYKFLHVIYLLSNRD